MVSSVGVLESGQTGPTKNLFECLMHGIVTEDGRVQSISNIFQVMGLYGAYATDGAVRVVSCEFLVSGITGILTYGATLKAQKNIFSGVWDEGIHAAQNLNSESITINEDNQFTISAAQWFYGIYVERPQALTGTHCLIEGNTFTVTSNPTNGFGLDCIHIEDFVSAMDEMEISSNTITVNSTKGGIYGIRANMGSSDQLNIHDNTIHYGTVSNTWVSYGIWLQAIGGQNLSFGNIIRDNTVTGINVGAYPDPVPVACYCGLHIYAIQGTEFCNNFVDSSFIGIHFSGSNKVALRSSHINHHTFGLRITSDDGKIGVQDGTGNQWDLDPDACVNFAAQNEGMNPLNSLILTNGDDLPWLPDHDKIDPDPNFSGFDWFHDGGLDEILCHSPLEPPLARDLTPSEKEAVLSTSTLSGVKLWDLERDVYTKLLVYPDLRPSSSPEETLFNNLNGTLIDSLAQVTYQVRNALSLSSGDQTDFDTYWTAIEQAFEDLVTLDESLDYSDLTNLTGTWFLQRDTLLKLIASNAADEAALESTRDVQVSDDLEDALAYNSTIATAITYGTARKTINELLVSHLLALPMTEALYDEVLTLVQQDEEDTGAATEEGARFLGPCDQGQYWNKEEYPAEEHGEVSNRLNGPLLQVIPNPTSGLTEIRLPKNSGGLLSVYNSQGQKITTLSVFPTTSKVFLDLNSFSNSYYWIIMSTEDGKVLSTAKVFVSH